MKRKATYLSLDYATTLKASGLRGHEIADLIGLKNASAYYKIKNHQHSIDKKTLPLLENLVVKIKNNDESITEIIKERAKKRKHSCYKDKITMTCLVCGEKFRQYDDDDIPVCKPCFEMKEAIRKNRSKLKLYWQDE